jgi:hypothetical protein
MRSVITLVSLVIDEDGYGKTVTVGHFSADEPELATRKLEELKEYKAKNGYPGICYLIKPHS